MVRLTKDLIAQVATDTSLIRLIEATSVKLVAEDGAWVGPCPFHEDDQLSLRVDPATNRWVCRGQCAAEGSVIDWVMKWNGVSFRHAVELLRNDPNFSGFSPHPLKISRVRRLACPVTVEAEDQQLLQQVVDYYHQTLKSSPEALGFFERRGLINSEMIDQFRLGYANRTLGIRLPQSRTKAGDTLRHRLHQLGVIRDSGHEHFNGCIVFPIFDENRCVTYLYGRRAGHEVRYERLSPDLYLPGPPRGVWNIEALQASKEIILCEDIIDALTFWCAGYRNVTASYGIDGFTPDHIAAFKKYGIQRVLIAYSRTETSENAAQLLTQTLLQNGIDCYRLHFPKDMGANDYALQVTPAEKSLGVVIRAATWLGKGTAPARDDEAIIVEESEANDLDLAQDALFQKEFTQATADEVLGSPIINEPPSIPDVLAASPVTPPRTDISVEVNGDTVVLLLGDRRYRIRGLGQNLSLNQMRVNVMASRGEAFHVDMLELHSARQRVAFAAHAAKELNVKETVIQKDLGKAFLKLEELQERKIEQAITPEAKTIELTEEEKTAALELLRDPKLLDRILHDFQICGVVGEETNKLVGYLAAVSRKLDKPLAVIVQSTSAAGKSSLMDAVLAFVPEEERIQYSAITGQALYYMGNMELKHKVLALSEEEGASRASYALKLLQSEGRLTIASTGKKPETGELVTRDYSVEGPVMIFMTTTAIDIDNELLNRCLVLAVDEDRDQTRAIHQLQRESETLEGLIAKEERQHLLKLHQNAQRLLHPIRVVNPYATQLTFPDQATRTRRDHTKYLILIRAITLLRQYQRDIKTTTHRSDLKEYIEVTLDDIAVANRLAHDVLGRTLDELPPQTRGLLLLVDKMVRGICERLAMERSDVRFSRRDVRSCTGWGDTQLKVHLARLVDLEYILVHRGGRGQSFIYELLYDGQGQDGRPFLQCLIDVDKLGRQYDENRSGQTAEPSALGRPIIGDQSAVSGAIENAENSLPSSVSSSSVDQAVKKSDLEPANEARPYAYDGTKREIVP